MGLKQRNRQTRHEMSRAQALETPEIEIEEDPSLEQDQMVEIVPETKADDPYEILQREYEAIKSAREREKADFEAQLAAQSRRASDLEGQVSQASAKEQQSQEAVLYHALAAARAEADQAAYAYSQARQSGDYASEVAAQRAMARAEAQILRLEDGQAAFEARKSEPAPARTQAPADPIEDHLKSYTPRTQSWLREHKSDIFGSKQRGNLAYAGHILAEENGLRPDTDEYFDFLDDHMGYSAPYQVPQQTSTPRIPRVAVSAPVSRSSSTSPSPARIKLTPAEAAFADSQGIPRERYAINKAKIAAGQAGKMRFE